MGQPVPGNHNILHKYFMYRVYSVHYNEVGSHVGEGGHNRMVRHVRTPLSTDREA